MNKTRYSQAEAAREIDKISDRYAFSRYTVAEAVKDDEMGYLIECFLKQELDLDRGRKVTPAHLRQKLMEFNRGISFKSSEAQFIAENRLVRQDTGLGQVYYECLVQDPAD
jgi:hypothetical protein